MSQTVTPTSDLSGFLGSNPGLNRLYDNVQAMVPSAGLAVIKMMAWNTIEDFYIRSTFRRENVYWTMGVGVQTVDFNPFDENWMVAWLLDISGLPTFTVRMPAFVTDTSLNGATALRSGQALVALKPFSYASQLPPDLFMQFFETLLDGTLYRLYMAPTKPYSSPQLAQFHGRRYSSGVAQARGIAQKNYTNGGGRWNFPKGQGFAMGRRKN